MLTSVFSNNSSMLSLPVCFSKCHCMKSCGANILPDSQQGVAEMKGEWQQDQSHSMIVIFANTFEAFGHVIFCCCM